MVLLKKKNHKTNAYSVYIIGVITQGKQPTILRTIHDMIVMIVMIVILGPKFRFTLHKKHADVHIFCIRVMCDVKNKKHNISVYIARSTSLSALYTQMHSTEQKKRKGFHPPCCYRQSTKILSTWQISSFFAASNCFVTSLACEQLYCNASHVNFCKSYKHF